MLLVNITRRTLGAPQSGQGRPTLLEEWHQEAASGSFRRSLSGSVRARATALGRRGLGRV
jgi:hypothetical protein